MQPVLKITHHNPVIAMKLTYHDYHECRRTAVYMNAVDELMTGIDEKNRESIRTNAVMIYKGGKP